MSVTKSNGKAVSIRTGMGLYNTDAGSCAWISLGSTKLMKIDAFSAWWPTL